MVMVSKRGLGACTAAVVAAMLLAACGGADTGSSSGSSSDSSSSSSSSTTAGSSSASAAQTGNASCIPTAPTSLPKDPDGIAATLDGAAKSAIAGYPGTVYKSPWSGFKPKHGPPWKIGFSNNQASLYGTGVLNGLKQAQAQNPGKVKDIVALTPAKPNDVTAQIQQMRSLLQQNVDVIYALLSSPTALNSVIDQAAKQGVPVISIAGQSTDKNAINLQPNPIQLGYNGAAGLVNAMGGKKGNVLVVQAIPGLTYNTQVLDAGLPVLKACGMKVVGTVAGAFDPATAKTAVLQFLASHPGKIDGVFQVSGMTPGIISAFQQVGRQVPPMGDINPGAPSLVYWKKNKSSYKGSGVAISPERTGEYTMMLGLALLSGRGVKVTDVPFAPPVITEKNLSEWVQPEWTSSTAAQANGPASALPIKALVDSYTSKP
jgi:ribose transport system substrate-binding protein